MDQEQDEDVNALEDFDSEESDNEFSEDDDDAVDVLAEEEADADDDAVEEAEAEEVLEALADHFAQQRIPPELQLTPQEHRNACRIKAAIEASSELDNLTDYEYGTLAIVTEGERNMIERALEIVLHTQEFKREYRVLDTYEDAIRHLQDIYMKQDGDDRVMLSVSENFETGGLIIVNDLPKLDLRRYKTHEQRRRLFTGNFYQSKAVTADFRVVRAGIAILVECEGYQWKNNMIDLNFFIQLAQNSAAIFPVKIHKQYFYNSPMLINTMVSIAKSSLPRRVTNAFEMGCKLPFGFGGGYGDARLDDMFNIPTKQAAENKLRQKLKTLLFKRYQNEKEFSLSSLSSNNPQHNYHTQQQQHAVT